MSKESIDRILREAYVPNLPYGFAERVAREIMGGEQGMGLSIWDLLLSISPKAGLAVGAVVTILLILGFTGSGPGIVESIDQYSSLSSLLPF